MQTEIAYKNVVKGVFDRSAAEYGQGDCRYYDYFAEGLVKRAQVMPGESVLDVATGRGAILKRIALQVGASGRAIGIDISPEMVAQTSAEWPLLQLSCMDAEKLDFADGTFDKIFCGFALFFFPHPEQALKEFYRVLKPGGQIFITTFRERDECHRLLREMIKDFGVNRRLSLHSFESEESLRIAISGAGFSDIHLDSDEWDQLYASPEAWMETLWSHGTRWMLEQLSDAQYRELRTKLCERLVKDLCKEGFHESLRVFYSRGSRKAI